jgi:hydrogenase 3 maturation protease
MRRADRPLRIAVVGIGHELRGDDAAGIAVACALQAWTADGGPQTAERSVCRPPSAVCRLLVINAGPAPENHTGPLRRFKPDLVLLVDAAQIGEAPGTVRYLAWQATTGLSASTHTLPPYVFANYLTASLGCEVALLGIQPADTSIGAPFSPAVRQAVEVVAQVLADALFYRQALTA